MDPADTPRRPSPARRTTRSIGGLPAPCGPADACPAPTAPRHAQGSPPNPLTAHSADTGTAHHPTAAASRLRPPYREGRQPSTPGVERHPDESLEVVDHQRDGTRRGRCREQPTTNGTRPRDGESPLPERAGGPPERAGGPTAYACVITRTRATAPQSCGWRSPADRRCTWRTGLAGPPHCCLRVLRLPSGPPRS